MNTIVLLTALTAGQQPAPPASGGVYLPPIPNPGAVAPAPVAQPPMKLPVQDVPPAGMPPMNGNGMGEEKKEDEKKDEEKKDEAKKPEPYLLMRSLKGTGFGNLLDDNGISISGWVQGNYTASSADRTNLPTTFNDRANFFQMNQNFLRINKDIDTSKEEFQLGFRTEWILPGTDARFSQSRGLFNGQTGDYQFDLFQAYGEAYLPNVGPKGSTVRVGKFATLVGYELVQGAETPFVSRSYLFQYNPFTHTGAMVTTQLDDTWTVVNGLVQGADNTFSSPNQATYIGQLKWAPKEGKSNALFNVVLTDPRFDASRGFPFYNVYNLVYTRNISDKFTYVLDATFSHIDGAPLGNGAVGSATWYGAANYLIYKHCDNVTSTFRAEVFEDTKGFRTGSQGTYTALTYGVAYAPKPGVIFRPFARYDHNSDSRPFEGKSNLYTAGMDVILRY